MPSYIPLLGLAALALTVFAFVEWRTHIRPMFVPRSEIESIAEALIREHGDHVEAFALIEEYCAWRYSQNLEQGKWRRARKALEQRRALDSNQNSVASLGN